LCLSGEKEDGWPQEDSDALAENYVGACEVAGTSSLSYAHQLQAPHTDVVIRYHEVLRDQLIAHMRGLEDGAKVLAVGHGPTMATAVQDFTSAGVPFDIAAEPCQGMYARLKIDGNGITFLCPTLFKPELS
jgi:hypothetical protein